ncbi:MAG: 4Fe-4S dicluster domain-containing protein [Candidatus Lokiarchaeota archaeon]|nr:4Fe-4S dicluster domain-containing protein [Candidatus Lokiarchaeota archaeon]
MEISRIEKRILGLIKIIKRVRIKISKRKCIDPIECGLKCVKACPYKLLAYIQTKTPEPGQAPERFKIVSAFMILCNACGKCIESCPENAIKLVIPNL